MQLRTFFFLLFFAATAAQAQNPVGVWEGSFFLQKSKKNKMNVRLEILQTETELIGVISTRGYDRGAVYGCDYLVSGRMNGNRLRFTRLNVRRGVAMSKEDCGFFQRVELLFSTKDTSSSNITGKWIWDDESEDNFSATKTDRIVSESAKEEVESYIRDIYANFEDNGIMLLPQERLSQKAGDAEVDSTELIIDINSLDKSENDSITVLLNGEPVAQLFNLHKKPLRIRLQKVEAGISDILIVSESQKKSKLKLQLTIRQKELVKEFIVEPGFVRNVMLLLIQKQE